ncbi:DUF6320 domain-containing protein [Gulosibacter chungangensis]|uniref:DUF2089 domain-containing protein n=1 Tax=Gulosibacter chungangensis TaxID=979746 RepID=A0A7J5BFB3_9MICO|nr:DUF6320 domain-containing protein [Gulosibacter chungangensis]KAB1644924.1 hypothetical protein F8O05_01250 [Gulosibacter chungangensis]
MNGCEACKVTIEGAWMRCPLCGASTTGTATTSPLPAVPLKFSRRRLLTVLAFSSLGLVVGSFAVQLFFGHDGVGVVRSIWLGVMAMWLVVLTAVRKRRNVAKSTVYLVLIVGLICVYWDYLTGWNAWSLTYAVPIMSASAVVGLLIAVRLMRMELGEYLVYSGVTALLGLLPILFLVFGWVTNPVPSIICVVLSAIILVLQLVRIRSVGHELGKRFHL